MPCSDAVRLSASVMFLEKMVLGESSGPTRVSRILRERCRSKRELLRSKRDLLRRKRDLLYY